jgi:hypothetical protein
MKISFQQKFSKFFFNISKAFSIALLPLVKCFQKCAFDVYTLLMKDHELGEKLITLVTNDIKMNASCGPCS